MLDTALSKLDYAANNLVVAADGLQLDKLFGTFTEKLKTWGGAFLVLIGAIMLLIGIFFLAQKLLTQQSQHGWGKIAALIVIGGIIGFAGFNFARGAGQVAVDTLKDAGLGGDVLKQQEGGKLYGSTIELDKLLPAGFAPTFGS